MRNSFLIAAGAAAILATAAIAQAPPPATPGAPKAEARPDPGPPGTVKIEPGFSTKDAPGAPKVQITPPIPTPPTGAKSDVPPPPPAKTTAAPPTPGADVPPASPPPSGAAMPSPRDGHMDYAGKGPRPWHHKGKGRSKAAHFRIDRPGDSIDVKCAEDEPMRACVDAAILFIDKMNAPR